MKVKTFIFYFIFFIIVGSLLIFYGTKKKDEYKENGENKLVGNSMIIIGSIMIIYIMSVILFNCVDRYLRHLRIREMNNMVILIPSSLVGRR